jgi:predicted outer membrane protein
MNWFQPDWNAGCAERCLSGVGRAGWNSTAEKQHGRCPSTPLVCAVVLAVSVGWWLTGAAVGQAMKAGDKDQQFLRHAASDGLAEVQLGQMAAERSTNPEVQRFGQRMASDHTKANQELMALAQSKNISIPKDIEKKHQKAAGTLAKKHGTSFDREYMRDMITDHEKAVQLFTTEANEGRDADIKAFARKTLPTLQEHLQMARQLTQQQGNMSQAR